MNSLHRDKDSNDISQEYGECVDDTRGPKSPTIKHCTEDGLNPIHFVRYEDLVVDIGEPTKKVMAYLLEIEDITRVEDLSSTITFINCNFDVLKCLSNSIIVTNLLLNKLKNNTKLSIMLIFSAFKYFNCF